MDTCCYCKNYTKLVKAHIIPRFFYPKNSSTRLYADKIPYTKKRPIGAYDQYILCGSCDNKIGSLDNNAKQIFLDRKGVIDKIVHHLSNGLKPLKYYTLKNKDNYELLFQFFISVLWRASISKSEDFSSFQLGKYESLARNSMFTQNSEAKKIFSFSICHLDDIVSPINFYSSKFTRIHGVNFYSWILGYFKILIKVDQRPTPKSLEYSSLSSKQILMVDSRLDEIADYESLLYLLQQARN